jgi:hypothetical protein
MFRSPGKHYQPWTDDQVGELRRFAAEGRPAREIEGAGLHPGSREREGQGRESGSDVWTPEAGASRPISPERPMATW